MGLVDTSDAVLALRTEIQRQEKENRAKLRESHQSTGKYSGQRKVRRNAVAHRTAKKSVKTKHVKEPTRVAKESLNDSDEVILMSVHEVDEQETGAAETVQPAPTETSEVMRIPSVLTEDALASNSDHSGVEEEPQTSPESKGYTKGADTHVRASSSSTGKVPDGFVLWNADDPEATFAPQCNAKSKQLAAKAQPISLR